MKILFLLLFCVINPVYGAFITPGSEAPVQTLTNPNGTVNNGNNNSGNGSGGEDEISTFSNTSNNAADLFAFDFESTTRRDFVGKMAVACRNIQAVLSIVNVYIPVIKSVTSALPPFVGTILNQATMKSVFVEVCDLVFELENATTLEAVFAVKRAANKATAYHYDSKFQFADVLFDSANILYDFEDGGFKQGSMASAATHRQLLATVDSGKRAFSSDERGLETNAERSRSIQKMAQLATRRALLEEALSCPQPGRIQKSTDDLTVDQSKKYNDFVRPLDKEQRINEREIEFFFEKLVEVGSNMFTELDKYDEYLSRLQALRANGAPLSEKIRTKRVLSEVSTGQFTKDGTVYEKQNETKEYKRFSAKINYGIYDSFINKYKDKYKSFMRAQIYTKQGISIFYLSRDTISAIGLDALCRPVILEKKNKSELKDEPVGSDKYQKIISEAALECKESLSEKTLDDSDSIFKELVATLRQFVSKKSIVIAKIWSTESKDYDIHRTLAGGDGSFSPTGKPPRCKNNMTTAGMEKMEFQYEVIESKLKTNILAEEIKITKREEAIIDAKIAEKENADLTRELNSKKQANDVKLPSQTVPIIPLNNL
jgi:hypothetical protein